MTEFKIQTSVKDHDGDMVNFRADSPEELAHQFATFPYAEYAQAKAALRGSAAAAPIVQPAGVPQQSDPWGQPPVQPTQPVVVHQQSGGAQLLHPEGKQCQACGTVLAWKQFNRKSDNKLMKMWSCPNGRSRDDGHTTDFVWN